MHWLIIPSLWRQTHSFCNTLKIYLKINHTITLIDKEYSLFAQMHNYTNYFSP